MTAQACCAGWTEPGLQAGSQTFLLDPVAGCETPFTLPSYRTCQNDKAVVWLFL